MPHHQLIVVGGGLAGLRAAVEAGAAGIDVAILSQVHPGRSHSGAAQGGINAALANNPDAHDDTPEKHAFDTVKGSDYLADQDAAIQMTKGRPRRHLRDGPLGLPVQPPRRRAHRPAAVRRRRLPAHLLRRRQDRPLPAAHAGRARLRAPDQDVHRGVRHLADRRRGPLPRRRRLRHDPRRVRGVHGRRRGHGHGRRRPHLRQLHQRHHQHRRRRGDRLPRRRARRGHGVHPVPPHRPAHQPHPHVARPAAARAATSSTTRASASWPSTRPRRWSWRRATSPRGPSPPRSTRVAASAARTSSTSTCGTSAPSVSWSACRASATSPSTSRAWTPSRSPSRSSRCSTTPWAASTRDVDGRTRLPGFYAAGECACVSVHGANRLGGNSLLETIVFGRRAGMAVVADLEGGSAGGGDASAAGRPAVAAMEAASPSWRRAAPTGPTPTPSAPR